MIPKIQSTVTFGKSQPIGGDLKGVRKDLDYKVPPCKLAYLVLKYKNK